MLSVKRQSHCFLLKLFSGHILNYRGFIMQLSSQCDMKITGQCGQEGMFQPMFGYKYFGRSQVKNNHVYICKECL
jgi:hypothetical protein